MIPTIYEIYGPIGVSQQVKWDLNCYRVVHSISTNLFYKNQAKGKDLDRDEVAHSISMNLIWKIQLKGKDLDLDWVAHSISIDLFEKLRNEDKIQEKPNAYNKTK